MSVEQQALKKIADYLSNRSHSEQELVLKLSKKFSADVIEQALHKAKQNKWMETPLELSEKVTHHLHQKNKSWSYIQDCLRKKNLPLPSYDHKKELDKVKNLLLKKTSTLKGLSPEEQIKLKKFLSYKGFTVSVVNEVLD